MRDQFDLNFIRSMMPDEGFATTMIQLFKDQIPETVEGLRRALQLGDWKTIRELTHRQKSSCKALGLTDLAEICTSIEKQIASNVIEPHILTKLTEEVMTRLENLQHQEPPI